MNISFLSAHPSNFLVRSRTRGDIKYLVVHYTANNGDTARGNALYFSRTELRVSAHYFVDDTSIWQTVEDKDQAYHTGTKGEYFHPECRNENSIGIEMCSRKTEDGVYYFTPAVVNGAIELIRELMKKYDIDIDHVVRHYDVTHKICPAPFVNNEKAWQEFKMAIVSK